MEQVNNVIQAVQFRAFDIGLLRQGLVLSRTAWDTPSPDGEMCLGIYFVPEGRYPDVFDDNDFVGAIVDGGDCLEVGAWMPTQTDLLATDWYISTLVPPTAQVVGLQASPKGRSESLIVDGSIPLVYVSEARALELSQDEQHTESRGEG